VQIYLHEADGHFDACFLVVIASLLTPHVAEPGQFATLESPALSQATKL
jgi:hypothetical protein